MASISNDVVQKAMVTGSQDASAAFSKLSGEKVNVRVSEVEYKSCQEILSEIEKLNAQNPVFAYSQIIQGISGVSFLIMSREEALDFIDLLNKRPLGTTGVLMDIDRSAIKETLNILSNSYLNSIAKHAGQVLLTGDPRLITSNSIKDILSKVVGMDDQVIVFRTVLEFSEKQISTELYLLFHEGLVSIMKETI